DTFISLVAVKPHAGKVLEGLPILAPALSADNVERRVGKSMRTQRTHNPRGRQEILSRFHCAQRDQPQGAAIAFQTMLGAQAEDVVDRRSIERDDRIRATMRGKLLPGIA